MDLTSDQKIALVAQNVQVRMDEATNSNGAIAQPTAQELANLMMTSLANLDSGDALGTVLANPATGATADRLLDGTTLKWRITTPGDPSISYDTSPTLAGWTVVYTPPS